MMIRILTATAAALLATSASAGQPRVYVDDLPRTSVSYAGLNLRTTDGRSDMTRRIRSAAEGLCKDSFVEVSITEPERNDCYTAAVASGMRQVDTLTRL